MIIVEDISGEIFGARSADCAAFMHIRPEPAEIDVHGHVNNAIYLFWVQDIAIRHWERISAHDGLSDLTWIILKHNIEYRDEIRLGDDVEIKTWLGSAKGPRMTRFVSIRKFGAKRFAAHVETEWCCLDVHSRKPRRAQPALDRFWSET